VGMVTGMESRPFESVVPVPRTCPAGPILKVTAVPGAKCRRAAGWFDRERRWGRIARTKEQNRPGADVRAVDPFLGSQHVVNGVELVDLSADEVAAADAVILLVDHDDLDYEVVTANAAYVLDCRRRVQGPNVEHL